MKLEAERLYLRPLKSEDANGDYPSWLNDTEVCKYNSHGDILYTRNMALEYIKKVNKSSRYKVFAIIDKKTNKHIGNISLQQINKQNKTAEFAILLGDKDFWGKGYAKEASKALIEYGFKTLKLKKIYCGTSEENIPMQKLATNLYFSKEKIMKKNISKNGKLLNTICYGIYNENL